MSDREHLTALETLVADGHREIIRRLSRLDQLIADQAPSSADPGLPDLEAWKADLDAYLLLQRSAFRQTIRSELPKAWIATVRSLRRQARVQTGLLLLFILLSVFQQPSVTALLERMLP